MGHDELDILVLQTLGVDFLTVILFFLFLLGLSLALLAVVVIVVVVVVVIVIVVVTSVLSLGVGLSKLSGGSLLSGGVDVLDLSLTKDTAGRLDAYFPISPS